ncbi:MAG: ABC-type sulfate/molybdate transport system, ATPase component, partial [Caproiciproducens sp.]|nr:ABC-type sulfate/molybdate transport system, ATPase component [Caproiciproducens sp.]
VSHNRDEVYRLCDRIAVLSDGKIEVISEKRALFEDPKTLAATLLTGCKNISKAQKLSDYTLRALDWNTVLTTERKIPDDLLYVGVRAHYFIPYENQNEDNIIRGKITRVTEDPFSMIVTVQCEGAQSTHSCIRWELSKKSYQEFEENRESVFLKILPKDILMMSS